MGVLWYIFLMALILFGYYGFDNVGDEQLLNETVRLIQEMPVNGSILVANGPSSTPFPSFNRWNVVSWIKGLLQSRVLIFGGGSVFQSVSSVRSLMFYLLIVQLAKWCRCRVVVLCHGWGPFTYDWHERLAAWGLRHADRSWRFPVRSPAFIKDPVFCDLTLTQSTGPLRSASSDTVGISFRSEPDVSDVSAYFRREFSVIRLNNEPNSSSNGVFLCDVWDSHDLSLSFVVTDRYHTAIWASKHGIPWVAISTDVKLVHLAQVASQRCYASITEFMNATDWQDGLDGVALQVWVGQQASFRLKIKDWLYEHIAH